MGMQLPRPGHACSRQGTLAKAKAAPMGMQPRYGHAAAKAKAAPMDRQPRPRQPPMGMQPRYGHVPAKAKVAPMGKQPRPGHAAAMAKAAPHGHAAAKAWACMQQARHLGQGHVYLCCNPVKQKSTERQAEKYESALQLAEFLIERDTSWETTYPGTDQSKPVLHKYGSGHTTEKKVGEGTAMSSIGLEEAAAKTQEGATKTPLFLATRSGCVEIVEKILKSYPQAVEHIDERGRNILHIAIKYRQLKIYDLVKNMELPMRRLTRKIDEDGNSILHTVGIKSKDYVPEKMQGPALELQDELRWFERVKIETPTHYLHHRNNQNLTAEGLFNETNKELRGKGIEWIKRTAEGCSVVAVLIATVAFAAAYTIPGGSNDKTGIPLFLNQPFFVVFTVADVLSISFALTSVVVFLAIITSPFRFADFRHSLPNKLTFGLTLLFLSVSMMMLSFAATVLLMIKNGEGWTKVLLYAMSFMPVGLFALSYFPLYLALSKTYNYLLGKAWQVISQSRSLSRETKTFHRTSNSPYPQYTMSV
ncbi:ankyrin repeat-containing protein ITN1-like [Quercus suber]|uniref:ankyrin repeat-containing protein ITN1-like n=1 Tax=Quercus suber TaxID=58331 RepID=UPI0032DEA71D